MSERSDFVSYLCVIFSSFLPSPPHLLPGCCSACWWWSDVGGRERRDPEWRAKGEGKPGKGPLPRRRYLPPGWSPQRSGRRSCQTPLWKVGPCCLPTGSFSRPLVLFKLLGACQLDKTNARTTSPLTNRPRWYVSHPLCRTYFSANTRPHHVCWVTGS